MVIAVSVLVMLSTLAVPLAAAQSIADPLVQRTNGKADRAQADPEGYAREQATEEALANDANWTIAYGCYAADTAIDETGAPVPLPDRCDGFEEAVGVAPDPDDDVPEVDPDVADVQELGPDPVNEAEVLAQEAADAVADVAADPLSAPERVMLLAQRALAATQRIVDGIIGGVTGTLGTSIAGLQLAGGVLAKGAGYAIAAPAIVPYWIWSQMLATAATLGAGLSTAADAIGNGVTGLSAAIGNGAAATADTVASALDDLRSTLESIIGGRPTPDSVRPADGTDLLDDPLTPASDDVLGIVDDIAA